MTKITVITIGLPLASIIGMLGCRGAAPAPVVPYDEEETFVIHPFNIAKKTIEVDTGSVFEGYFTVKGRGDIRFYIEDTQGDKVLDVTVEDRYEFSHATTLEGPHRITMNFDNSSTTTKQIDLRWRVRESEL